MDAAPPNQPATAGFANTRYQVCAGVNDFMAQMSITSQPPAELRGLRCTPVCFGFFLKIKFPQSNDPQILLTSCFVDLHSCHPAQPCLKTLMLGKLRVGADLLLFQTMVRHSQRRRRRLRGAPARTLRHITAVCRSLLSQQKPACATPVLDFLWEAGEDGEVCTRKTRSFPWHMAPHLSGVLSLPHSSIQVLASLGNAGRILPGPRSQGKITSSIC